MMFADQTDLAEGRRIVAQAREHGVNFIDNADVYSNGRSETMVGEAIREGRDDWIVATKVGNRMSAWTWRSRFGPSKYCCAQARFSTGRLELSRLVHR